MKELKFRAWDKQFKFWVNPEIVSRWAIYSFEHPSSITHEITQFTGLYDKHKNEIYEGDIIKYSFKTKQTLSYPPITHVDPGWEIWEINYIAPSFVYVIHSQSNSYYGELPSKPRVTSLHYLNAVEVIGNIYENPELLHPK